MLPHMLPPGLLDEMDETAIDVYLYPAQDVQIIRSVSYQILEKK